MKLDEFCRGILFSDQITQKLFIPDKVEITQYRELDSPPATPGRPKKLRMNRTEMTKVFFPGQDDLQHPVSRGLILHFFANHELLAMELMALTLLKFPDADEKFRAGILKTIHDEQTHLSMYIARMKELGVSFGDFPVNGFFWSQLSGIKTTTEYTALMSMTFEQANLDFALFYKNLFEKVEDSKTASLLNKVLEDEIQHVHHGVTWFNRWQNPSGKNDFNQWDNYCHLVKPFSSPSRAKSKMFNREARIRAGLSKHYIDSLEVYDGAATRPPRLWVFNPFFEEELLRQPGSDSDFLKSAIETDLSSLLMFLASPGDAVLSESAPELKFLKQYKKLGVSIPQFLSLESYNNFTSKFSGFEPWGWSERVCKLFQPKVDALTSESEWQKQRVLSPEDALNTHRALASKSFSQTLLKKFFRLSDPDTPNTQPNEALCGVNCDNVQRIIAQKSAIQKDGYGQVIVKAQLGASGRNQLLIKSDELRDKKLAQLENMLRINGTLVVEPFLSKISDLSVLLQIPRATDKPPKILGISRFFTKPNRQYSGHLIGSLFTKEESFLSSEFYRQRYDKKSYSDKLKEAAVFVAHELKKLNYHGPVGIDAILYKDDKGDIFLKPIVEINLRFTMGNIALQLQKFLKKGSVGVWVIRDAKSWKKLKSEMIAGISLDTDNRLKICNDKIESGYIPTNCHKRASNFYIGLFVQVKKT